MIKTCDVDKKGVCRRSSGGRVGGGSYVPGTGHKNFRGSASARSGKRGRHCRRGIILLLVSLIASACGACRRGGACRFTAMIQTRNCNAR